MLHTIAVQLTIDMYYMLFLRTISRIIIGLSGIKYRTPFSINQKEARACVVCGVTRACSQNGIITAH